MKSTELVVVENISYKFPPQLVIQNLSFTVKRGECLALIGANGSGKTTTLYLLAGLLRPLGGQIFINEFNIHTQSLLAKQHFGFLSDSLPLYHDLTVKEYLNLICKLRQIPKQSRVTAIQSIVENLQLQYVLERVIGTLSRGLKQRVGIAQAVIHRPSVLLLDEPTQGLDPQQIEIFQTFLNEYKKDSAIVLSSHYANEVEHLCNLALLFNSEGVKFHDLHHCPA